ncbi:hypothetical protein L596_013278 [Steinernema carpocapsae]|uniref:Uncharacterized protein n=1 Tax=Steinernema carpocapsae TaxID=34508 RepID=A0A4U5P0I2_STECR|nr:hypothetical protein L596_013278 [Steinernema carpocapsae]
MIFGKLKKKFRYIYFARLLLSSYKTIILRFLSFHRPILNRVCHRSTNSELNLDYVTSYQKFKVELISASTFKLLPFANIKNKHFEHCQQRYLKDPTKIYVSVFISSRFNP